MKSRENDDILSLTDPEDPDGSHYVKYKGPPDADLPIGSYRLSNGVLYKKVMKRNCVK